MTRHSARGPLLDSPEAPVGDVTSSSTSPVRHADAVPAGDRTALIPVPQSSGELDLFERLARDPNVSVEKIAGLMALWERGEAKRAESAFSSAMVAAQHEMRPVAVDSWNPQTKSKYASFEALDGALRPIYTKHGFALTFNTADAPQPDYIRVVCKARHIAGHSEAFTLDLPADGKGAKGGDVMTKTHATGSGLSYGQRYLLKMVFNVATGEGDDDGNGASGTPPAKDPDGYALWLDELSSAADEGRINLTKAWNESKVDFRNHLLATNKPAWESIKKKAQAVGR